MLSKESKYNDAWRVLLQDSILSVMASLLALLLVRWLTAAMPGFSWILARWLGFALAASLTGFLTTQCYRYVRRYATIRSLGHVTLAIVVKELLLVVALLLRLMPGLTAVTLPRFTVATFSLLLDQVTPGLAVPAGRTVALSVFVVSPFSSVSAVTTLSPSLIVTSEALS